MKTAAPAPHRLAPRGTGRPAPAATPASAMLALQRTAGNRAVARLVKIGKAIGSTDKVAARQKAEALRALRLRGQWDAAQDERAEHYLDFFEGEALDVFIRTLASTDKEESYHGGKTINDPKGGNFTIGARTATFPLSKPREQRGGFRVSYFAQVFAEDSQSTSVEVSTEWYGNVEGGVQIPIKKIFYVKAAAGKRWSKKQADKDEFKKAKRVGTGISQNFKVKKLERDVFQINYVQRSHGYRLEPWEEDPEAWEGTVHPLPAGHLATKTTASHRGTNPRVPQHGWLIEPEEGGPPWGPLWNRFYNFEEDRGSALVDVWKILEEQQRALAEMLVFGE